MTDDKQCLLNSMDTSRDFLDNNGTDARLPDDEAKQKVKEQVEFYFSDSNLPRDKFLRETVEADPAGYVDISLLMTFSRLRTLLARVSNAHHVESTVDVAALLETSKVLAVSTDKRRVRRISELRPREVVDAEVEQRSVYASPFPMDVSIDDLTKFFSKHTKILSIRLRRHVSSKDFKGSIFLELPDAASCAALILKSGELEFDGAPLNLVKKQTYLSSKKVQVR